MCSLMIPIDRSVGHAAVAVAEFCTANLDAPITVLVASGDGILHEIINDRTLPKIHFVLVVQDGGEGWVRE